MRRGDEQNRAWTYYELGRAYNNSLTPNQYQLVNTNIEFFAGNQWLHIPETEAMSRLARPTFNIIKRIASLFVASLTSSAVTVSFEPLSYYDGENLARVRDFLRTAGSGSQIRKGSPSTRISSAKRPPPISFGRRSPWMIMPLPWAFDTPENWADICRRAYAWRIPRGEKWSSTPWVVSMPATTGPLRLRWGPSSTRNCQPGRNGSPSSRRNAGIVPICPCVRPSRSVAVPWRAWAARPE